MVSTFSAPEILYIVGVVLLYFVYFFIITSLYMSKIITYWMFIPLLLTGTILVFRMLNSYDEFKELLAGKQKNK